MKTTPAITIDTPIVSGYYCEDGYIVQLNNEEIHRQERWSAPLAKQRSYCLQAARTLARKHNAIYAGITRTLNLEDIP